MSMGIEDSIIKEIERVIRDFSVREVKGKVREILKSRLEEMLKVRIGGGRE